jgi:rhodanese-related sulfurtransferase
MEPQRISVDELKRRLDSGESIAFIDARAGDAWQRAEVQIPGAIRVPPDEAEAHLNEIPTRRLVVPYCT